MNFAHLASFQVVEFVDRPVSKTLHIFVCQTSENEAFFTKHSLLQLLFAKNENTISSHLQSPRFLLGAL